MPDSRPSLQLLDQAGSHAKTFLTWAARLLDKGLRCRDTAPSRQCAFSTYCQQRHLGLRVLICELGQGGHRPCRAAAGSHQTTLDSD